MVHQQLLLVPLLLLQPINSQISLGYLLQLSSRQIQLVQSPHSQLNCLSQQFQLPLLPNQVYLDRDGPDLTKISASADLLDLDMSGTNTLNNIMAMHTAKQQVQQQQIQQPQPFQVMIKNPCWPTTLKNSTKNKLVFSNHLGNLVSE